MADIRKALVIGAGSAGRKHLDALHLEGINDVMLLRTHKGTMDDKMLSRYEQTDSTDEAARWNPDIVVVSNPTSLHIGYAAHFLNHAHILIEKPLSSSLGDARQLRKKHKEGVVAVGYQYRFNHKLASIKRLANGGTMGEVRVATATYAEDVSRWHSWEDHNLSYATRSDLGGGAALTLSHPVDYLIWMFGPPVRSSCFQSHHTRTSSDEAATICIDHEGGVTSTVHVNYHRWPKQHTLEVVCENGVLKWDEATGSVLRWSPKQNVWNTISYGATERYQMFNDQMTHFLKATEGGEFYPLCSLDEAIQTMEALQ